MNGKVGPIAAEALFLLLSRSLLCLRVLIMRLPVE